MPPREKKFRTLGEFIRKKRLITGLTQKELAKLLDYSPQFVANWESGVASPPGDIFPDLVRICRISEREILELLVDESRAYWESVIRPHRKSRLRRSAN